jgi:hypothetical protein
MSRYKLVFAIALSFVSSTGVSSESDLLLLRSDVSDSQFVFSVSERNLPDHRHINHFEIDCASCQRKVAYEEDTLDYPISIYRPSDSSSLFFSIWSTGSALRVRAFDLSNGSVKSVLDVGTKNAPQIFRDKSGEWLVSITNTDIKVRPTSASVEKGVLFKWDGTSFKAQ